MNRLGGILATALALVVLGGAAGVWFGIPYLEHRWTYFPVKVGPDKPWRVPDGAEAVTLTTTDGVRLVGWFFDARGPRRRITILVMHGNFGVLPRYTDDAELLRQSGFNVLLFNFRGFGMSDGFTKSEVTLDLDAAAALHYLTRERGIAATSIAFLGASLGAPVAASLATRSPCRAVVLISTVASAKRQAERDWPWLPSFFLDMLRSPFDTVAHVKRAKCPVLVIHGANDQVVPISQAQEVYDAARPPKRLIVAPNAGHGVTSEDDPAYLDRLISFLVSPS